MMKIQNYVEESKKETKVYIIIWESDKLLNTKQCKFKNSY